MTTQTEIRNNVNANAAALKVLGQEVNYSILYRMEYEKAGLLELYEAMKSVKTKKTFLQHLKP